MVSWALSAVAISCWTDVLCFDFPVKIQTPQPTIVFEKMGRLWPSVNYGHIRTTTNLTRLRQITNALCARTNELEELVNYTSPSIIRKLAPDISDEIAQAAAANWPTRTFKIMMLVALSEIQSKCESAQNEMNLDHTAPI